MKSPCCQLKKNCFMLRVIGCILTVGVGGAAGARAAGRLRSRYKKLLSHYIYIGEISDQMRIGVGLEEIFKSSSANGLIQADGYEVTVDGTDLNTEDRLLITRFFSELGMTDLEAGISRCTVYRELIYKRVCDAEQEMKSKSRLYSMLGLFFGLLTAILFI